MIAAVRIVPSALHLACVFCLRGLMAYVRAVRRRLSEAPFATLDRQFNGPLCLFNGSGLNLMTLLTLTGD